MVTCFFQIFVTGLALTAAITPLMAVPLSILGFFYVRIMSHFHPAARTFKRNESKTRSPIYTVRESVPLVVAWRRAAPFRATPLP